MKHVYFIVFGLAHFAIAILIGFAGTLIGVCAGFKVLSQVRSIGFTTPILIALGLVLVFALVRDWARQKMFQRSGEGKWPN